MWAGSADPNGSTISHVTRDSFQVVRHPRWFAIRKAWQQLLATPPPNGFGISHDVTFSLDGAVDFLDVAAMWNCFQGPMQGIGTGTAGENATFDLTQVVSQKFGAMLDYATPPATNALAFSGP